MPRAPWGGPRAMGAGPHKGWDGLGRLDEGVAPGGVEVGEGTVLGGELGW